MKFVISSRAEVDLFAIHSYFFERNPAVADRLITRFFQRFEELCEFPFLGPGRSELRPSLRGVLMENYIIFYQIEPDQIVIVRVLDSRMNIEDQFGR